MNTRGTRVALQFIIGKPETEQSVETKLSVPEVDANESTSKKRKAPAEVEGQESPQIDELIQPKKKRHSAPKKSEILDYWPPTKEEAEEAFKKGEFLYVYKIVKNTEGLKQDNRILREQGIQVNRDYSRNKDHYRVQIEDLDKFLNLIRSFSNSTNSENQASAISYPIQGLSSSFQLPQVIPSWQSPIQMSPLSPQMEYCRPHQPYPWITDSRQGGRRSRTDSSTCQSPISSPITSTIPTPISSPIPSPITSTSQSPSISTSSKEPRKYITWPPTEEQFINACDKEGSIYVFKTQKPIITVDNKKVFLPPTLFNIQKNKYARLDRGIAVIREENDLSYHVQIRNKTKFMAWLKSGFHKEFPSKLPAEIPPERPTLEPIQVTNVSKVTTGFPQATSIEETRLETTPVPNVPMNSMYLPGSPTFFPPYNTDKNADQNKEKSFDPNDFLDFDNFPEGI